MESVKILGTHAWDYNICIRSLLDGNKLQGRQWIACNSEKGLTKITSRFLCSPNLNFSNQGTLLLCVDDDKEDDKVWTGL